MGWERKRGKLEELNRLLRGATDTSFTVQVGNLAILPSFRHVLTLDTDTRLPRNAARTLIGILSHPLNRPSVDPALGRVTEGYGILQPRVSVTLASAAGSLFSRVYAGHTGVDPYTTAVSDTYQDLFGEGVFTGKGSTTWTPSKRPWAGASPRTRFSRTTFSKAFTREPRWSRTWRSWTSTRPTSSRTPGASTAGCAATGRSWPGCSRRSHARRLREESTAADQPMEDLRQPQAQPRRPLASRAVRGGLERLAGQPAGLDPRRSSRRAVPPGHGSGPRFSMAHARERQRESTFVGSWRR